MSIATDRFYVHWLAGDNDDDFKLKQSYANYFLSKTELKNQVAFNTYSNAIKNQFKGNDDEVSRYLNIISDIAYKDGSAFQKVLDQAFTEFSVLSTEAQSTTNITNLAKQLDTNANALDDIIKQYKDIIKFLVENIDITTIYGSTIMNPGLNDKAKKLFNITNNPNPLITKEE